jgi:hypothetical protein
MHDLSQPRPVPDLDWTAAARLVRPVLLPRGSALVADPAAARLVADGPAGLPVTYVVADPAVETPIALVHLTAWGVRPEDVQAVALENLASWDDRAGWVEENDGRRRMVWSDWGEGLDAARILLAPVRDRLAADLAPRGRVLVGLPERDLLIATGVARGDDEFEALFIDYVAGRSAAADRPIEAGVFELVDGELVAARVPVLA